ncbi:MAG: Coenzyme F420 hydrogenase/dehydrogenase, beta subunit C-terminal domain [Butyrivibrio sp.]|nr:Coenzyme F420 hydrogenase/dehydrogenase, beta subunit C-terminal domain [Butyrivibrio sp.]
MNNHLNRKESLCIQNSSNCIGCGLCPKVFGKSCHMELGTDGTYKIKFNGDIDESLFREICPVANNRYISSDIWGNINNAYFSNAKDPAIRFKGSSGGVTSALAVFLLEEKEVDGVIQVCADTDSPIKNIVKISRSAEEVLNCCGSRYSPVSVFDGIIDELKPDETYCLIGKPCDIRAFKNYMRMFPKHSLNIKYTLSFFCAGVPSANATKEVLKKLGVDEKDVVGFDYRGNGWPGYTQAVCSDGSKKTMEYNESWGAILGRNLHSACKFCVDGVGVAADISNGDAWFADEKGYPTFTEADGRNITLIRSSIGQELFNKAVEKGYIECSAVENCESILEKMQPYQYKRKALMYTKILMLRMFGKYTPQYDSTLKKWDKKIPFKDKFIYAKGTVDRILKKKIK